MLSGLLQAALILVLAWLFGWQAALGRIDPAFAIMWMPPVLLWQVWRWRLAAPRAKWGMALLTLGLLIAAQSAMVLAMADPNVGSLLRQIALVALWGGAIFGMGHALYSKFAARCGARWFIYFAANLICMPFAAWALGWLYTPATARVDAPRVLMLTSLPLRWSGATDLAHIWTGGEADDPALQYLEGLGPLQLLDSFLGQSLQKSDILFLAHPFALSPDQLVAIDQHVRGGGRAVILADALSSWPMPHALGDARNPPVTSLLTPLFHHWGIQLSGVAHGESGAQLMDDAGQRLRLLSAGRFSEFPKNCSASAGTYLLRCRIGAGEALILGDADYLHRDLWQGQSHLGWHLTSSDAMAWTAAILWGDAAGKGYLTPIWLKLPAS